MSAERKKRIRVRLDQIDANDPVSIPQAVAANENRRIEATLEHMGIDIARGDGVDEASDAAPRRTDEVAETVARPQIEAALEAENAAGRERRAARAEAGHERTPEDATKIGEEIAVKHPLDAGLWNASLYVVVRAVSDSVLDQSR